MWHRRRQQWFSRRSKYLTQSRLLRRRDDRADRSGAFSACRRNGAGRDGPRSDYAGDLRAGRASPSHRGEHLGGGADGARSRTHRVDVETCTAASDGACRARARSAQAAPQDRLAAEMVRAPHACNPLALGTMARFSNARHALVAAPQEDGSLACDALARALAVGLIDIRAALDAESFEALVGAADIARLAGTAARRQPAAAPARRGPRCVDPGRFACSPSRRTSSVVAGRGPDGGSARSELDHRSQAGHRRRHRRGQPGS